MLFIELFLLLADIALQDGSLSIALDKVKAIYQDTIIPMNFDLTMSFLGRNVPAGRSGSHVGFDVYLSDQEKVSPFAMNSGQSLLVSPGGGTMLKPTTANQIRELVDGSTYTISGTVNVTVERQHCNKSERYDHY